MKNPSARIHDIDTTPEAIRLTKELASLNQVNNITYHCEFFSPSILDALIGEKTLVLMDIEGAVIIRSMNCQK